MSPPIVDSKWGIGIGFEPGSTIHIYEGLGDAYRAASGWSTYTIIDDIPLPKGVVTISATADPTMGTVTGAGEYTEGDEVTLTAIPAKDYEFQRWSDDSTDNPYVFTATSDMDITAIFAPIGYNEGYSLHIADFAMDVDGSYETSVMMENKDAVTMIEFDVVLPDGLTIENEEGEYFVNLGSRVTSNIVRNQFTGCGEMNADGSIHFTARFLRSTSTYQFTGNEGEALTLPFIAEGLTDGYYEVQIKNVLLNGELRVAPSTINVKVGDLIRKLTDSEDFSETMDKEYDTVTYTRNFSEKNTDRWQAWYVPFDLDPTEYADDFTFARIYMMAYVNPNTHALVADPTQGELSVVLKYLEDGELVQAGTPYVIKAKQTGEQTFESVDGVLHAATENHTIASSTTSEVFTFSGNYESVTCPAGWYAIAASGGFIAAEDKTLSPYRWHFEVTPTGYGSSVQPAAVANARMYVMDEDNRLLTSVMNMQAQADSYRTYDMQGRLLKGRGAQHGISIRNGRKYVR